MAFASNQIPVGWLLCDGSTVKICIYQNLFSVIGHTYTPTPIPPPDGYFYLPDLRSRVPVGRDENFVNSQGYDLSFNNLGYVNGEVQHTLTINELASHNHGVPSLVDPSGNNNTNLTDSSGLHFHTVPNTLLINTTRTSDGTGLDDEGAGEPNLTTSTTSNSSQEGLHNHRIYPAGGNHPHNNMQPYIILNYIIKI